MEEVQQNLGPEVVPQETTSHDEQNASKAPESPIVDDRQDRNWKELNRAKKELERELRFQRELNEKLVQLQSPQVQKPQEIDEFDSIADDEYLQKGKVVRLVQARAEKIAEKAAQERVDKVLQEREKYQFMDKLKRQFPDFDDIVNPETLSILEDQDPELAESIAASQDPYKIGIQSYKYIKAMNLGAKTESVRRVKEVDKKLEKNEKTVQSPMAYEKRPMAQAFRMTDADKKKLAEEMYGYANMESSVPFLS